MTAKGMCCTRTIFHTKSALQRERWKAKWWNWELFQMICRLLYQLLSHPSPLISLCLPFYLSLCPSCTFVCFISETIDDGPFRAKGDIEADLETRGSDEAISLPLSTLVALWTRGRVGGQGQARARRSVPRAHDTLRDWFVEGERVGWTRGWTNA